MSFDKWWTEGEPKLDALGRKYPRLVALEAWRAALQSSPNSVVRCFCGCLFLEDGSCPECG